jgi:hypothetical protein
MSFGCLLNHMVVMSCHPISQLPPCFSPEEDYIGNLCAMLQLILEHVVSEKIFKSSSQIIWNCAWLSCFVAEWNEACAIAWSWIYNFLCNQCLSHLTLWVRMLLMRDVLDTTLSDNDCQWIAPGQNLTILSETTNLIFKTTVWYRKQLPFCDDLSGLLL